MSRGPNAQMDIVTSGDYNYPTTGSLVLGHPQVLGIATKNADASSKH